VDLLDRLWREGLFEEMFALPPPIIPRDAGPRLSSARRESRGHCSPCACPNPCGIWGPSRPAASLLRCQAVADPAGPPPPPPPARSLHSFQTRGRIFPPERPRRLGRGTGPGGGAAAARRLGGAAVRAGLAIADPRGEDSTRDGARKRSPFPRPDGHRGNRKGPAEIFSPGRNTEGDLWERSGPG
jgi:hypothetical protein